jgi:deazaflavin-dependent oxidoreductase (nitroreductase family)
MLGGSTIVPLPKRLAHFNRRVTNRFTRPIASWAPGFAVVVHVGRRSGRVYRTPVNVFRHGDRYVFALTYGSDSDWVRNVLAAGGCTIETRRTTVELTRPEPFPDSSRSLVPLPVRWALGVIGVDEFLVLTPAGGRREEPGRAQPVAPSGRQ